MDKQLPDLLLGITEQLRELAESSRRISARSQVLETLLANVVAQLRTDSLFDPPLQQAVEVTRSEVLTLARARPEEGRPHLDHVLLETLNDVLDNAGLMQPQTGG